MNISDENYGCKHYRRNVKLIAPCCCKTYYCRFCHDENEDHLLHRREVILVECVFCRSKQRKGKSCVFCRKSFARYICLICSLYDNVDKGQFHCDECGICRVGPRESYYHCQKCNLCLNKTIRNIHKCVENSSRTDCPLCLQDLHTSVKNLKVLLCGHILHQECYDKLDLPHQYRCILCRTILKKN